MQLYYYVAHAATQARCPPPAACCLSLLFATGGCCWCQRWLGTLHVPGRAAPTCRAFAALARVALMSPVPQRQRMHEGLGRMGSGAHLHLAAGFGGRSRAGVALCSQVPSRPAMVPAEWIQGCSDRQGGFR